MEPISPQRLKAKKDVEKVGTRFYAYRGAISQREVELSTECSLVSYLTRGGTRDLRDELMRELAGPSDWVVDTADARAAQLLVETVILVGRTAAAQGELF